MVLFFRENETALLSAAAQIGALIKPVTSQKRILTKLSSTQMDELKGYEVTVPIKTVQALAKLLGRNNIPKLVQGKFQAEVNRLNGL